MSPTISTMVDDANASTACKGYCDTKDENGKQQSISDVNLSESATLSAWAKPRSTNMRSNRRVYRQRQRQTALFAQLLRTELVLKAQTLTVFRW